MIEDLKVRLFILSKYFERFRGILEDYRHKSDKACMTYVRSLQNKAIICLWENTNQCKNEGNQRAMHFRAKSLA